MKEWAAKSWLWSLEIVDAEEGGSVEGAGESASAVGEEREEADDCEGDGPDLALVAQRRDFVLCRELLPTSEERRNEAPHQAQDAPCHTAEAQSQGREEGEAACDAASQDRLCDASSLEAARREHIQGCHYNSCWGESSASVAVSIMQDTKVFVISKL